MRLSTVSRFPDADTLLSDLAPALAGLLRERSWRMEAPSRALRERLESLSSLNSGEDRTASHAKDLLLARSAAAGDPESMEVFARRMGIVPALLHKLNGSFGRPLDDADLADLAQDTVARLWQKLPGFAGLSSLETWAYQFCARELMNGLRRKRRQRQFDRLDGTTNEQLIAEQRPAALDFEHLHSALDALDEPQAQAIRLKYFDDLTFEVIAERLGMPVNTIKTMVYRGLRKLKQRMELEGQEEEAR